MKSFTVLRLVIGAVKRKDNVTAKARTSIIKHEEKRGQRGPLCVTSEFGNKCIDESQADIKAEYDKQKG